MARKPKVDENVRSIIDRILTSPIPAEGQLLHPIQSKKREKKEESRERKKLN